jgi:hypothetical protein
LTRLFVYEARGRLGNGATKAANWFCVFRVSEGAGGGVGCALTETVSAGFRTNPVDVVKGNNPYDHGEYLWGIAANNVRRVVLIQAKGEKHNLRLSRDNGFIYDCGQHGCAGSIDSYAQGGRLLSSQRLPALG